MEAKELIRRLQEHDETVLEDISPTEPRLAEIVSIRELDSEARTLFIRGLARQPSTASTEALVQLLLDEEVQNAALAIHTLSQRKTPPPASALLKVLEQAGEPLIRRELFRLLGQQPDQTLRSAVRNQADREEEEDAQLWALAGLARFGDGEMERKLHEKIHQATSETASALGEIVLYVGSRRLATGLLSWLSQDTIVRWLPPHRNPIGIRMCDLAIWTAHRLGISLQPAPTRLDRYSEPMRIAARKTIETLPKEESP